MKIQYPLLIDGGLSNELEKLGCDLNHQLWSAHILDTHPEKIIKAHLSYLEAGAQCIITSSYQASSRGFMDLGYDKSRAESLILDSVKLAEQAVEQFMKTNSSHTRPLIAASIGPYGAYLANGSEYRGDYGLTNDELKEYHLSRIRLLDGTNADFFACETIPSFQETKVLADILLESKKSAWISFSCKDEHHINDGTPIVECASFLATHPNIFAIGVNCTAPKHISGLIQNLNSVLSSKAKTKKIVVYPNSGEVFNAKSKTWIGLSNPHSYVTMAQEWIELGADIIGGCCRIGPTQIRGLWEVLRNRIQNQNQNQ